MDGDESPYDVAVREIKAELGMPATPGRPLLVDWVPPRPSRTEGVMFLFDGGRHVFDAHSTAPTDHGRAVRLERLDHPPHRRREPCQHVGCHAPNHPRRWDGRFTAIVYMPSLLTTYFATFIGRRFELLGGGGARPDTRDRITAEDVIAVQMLRVTVPAARVIDLVEGDLGRQLSPLLAKIPTDLDLGDADAQRHLADGGPAALAWKQLNPHLRTGIGWVIAGKILARKRPRLIPVYDRVVRCTVGKPTGY